MFWSGVCVFFSERAPGVTAAVHGPDENPDPGRILQTRDNRIVPAGIGDIGDPDAAGSWNHNRAHGPGDRVINPHRLRLSDAGLSPNRRAPASRESSRVPTMGQVPTAGDQH